MMTLDQQSTFRAQVLAAIPVNPDVDAAYASKDCDQIAALMSVGRTRHGPTRIGPGTVVAVLGDRGGVFLDAVEALGATDRTVYWGFDPVRRGALDLSVPAAVASLLALKAKLPDFADDIDTVLQVGVIADPIAVADVHAALFEPDGTPK